MTGFRPRRRLGAALSIGFALIAGAHGGLAAELVIRPVEVTDTKAVYGRVESRFVVPARSRIGGTLGELDVTEGTVLKAGDVVGTVEDEKFALQLAAADARIAALRSELDNASTVVARAQALMSRGATTQSRLDDAMTQRDVLDNQLRQAEAERAVIVQQAGEGTVLAPAAGRVLTVAVRRGAVVMPGEAVATIAGGGVFLRLAIPERHAGALDVGASVAIGEAGAAAGVATGQVEKIYPQIENGRVVLDVAASDLSDAFIGKRVLVQVPITRRQAFAVPADAVTTRSGIDRLTLVTDSGPMDVTVVLGSMVLTPEGPRREVLSGLRDGDRVLLP